MLQIDNLVLRLSDMGEEEARRLGEEVAEIINKLLPEGLNGQIDSMDIQLPTYNNISRTELAWRIAERIVQKITYGKYNVIA